MASLLDGGLDSRVFDVLPVACGQCACQVLGHIGNLAEVLVLGGDVGHRLDVVFVLVIEWVLDLDLTTLGIRLTLTVAGLMRQHQWANLHDVFGVRDGLHGLAVVEEAMTPWIHSHLRIVRVVQVLLHVLDRIVFTHVMQLTLDACEWGLVVFTSGHLDGLAGACIKRGVLDRRDGAIGRFALVFALTLFVVD